MQPTNRRTLRGSPGLLALLLPLPLLASAAAPPVVDDEVDDPAGAASDEDDRARRRIVHLKSGDTVRAVVRRGEDGWEYRRSGDWNRLPLAVVEKVVLERDALKEWKRRWREARGEGLDARAALGAWSLESGLLEEGLATLERVLGDHADHVGARRALGAHARRFAVPRVDPDLEDPTEGTAELRRWAAGRGRALGELACLELARVRAREGLQETLAADLFAGSFRRRAFAAHALRRLFPGHEAERLVHRAVLDGSDEVREQAAFALREGGRVGAIVPVARALESAHHKVRTQAAEALGNMGYPAAVEPLMVRLAALQDAPAHNVPHSYIFTGRQFAYIQDFDVEVAQFQAVADPQVNVLIEGNVLDAGVHAIEEVRFAVEGRTIRSSLEKLTGHDAGGNRAWLRWWKEHGDQWQASKLADQPPVVPGGE